MIFWYSKVSNLQKLAIYLSCKKQVILCALLLQLLILLLFSGCSAQVNKDSATAMAAEYNACIDPNAKAMVCGMSVSSRSTGIVDSVYDIIKTQSSPSLSTSSSVVHQIGLYGGMCRFEILDQRLSYKIQKSQGNAFINAFRLGFGTDFAEFEKYWPIFPLSDVQCNINPKIDPIHDIRVDRFMNYLISGTRPITESEIEQLKRGEISSSLFSSIYNSYMWLPYEWNVYYAYNWIGPMHFVDQINTFSYRDTLLRRYNAFSSTSRLAYECEDSTQCYSGNCNKNFYKRGVCVDQNTGDGVACNCVDKIVMLERKNPNEDPLVASGIFCRYDADQISAPGSVRNKGYNEFYFLLLKDFFGNYYTDANNVFDLTLTNTKVIINPNDMETIIRNSFLVRNCGASYSIDGAYSPPRFVFTDFGKCELDADGTLELKTFGWCEPCTLATIAQQNTTQLPGPIYCPNDLRINYLGQTKILLDTGHHARHRGFMETPRHYCHFFDLSGLIGHIQGGNAKDLTFPAQSPDMGYLNYYLNYYLQNNIFPIVNIKPSLRYEFFANGEVQGMYSSVARVIGSANAKNRGPVMLSFEYDSTFSAEEFAKRIASFKFGQRVTSFSPLSFTEIKQSTENQVPYNGCAPTCLAGIALNSSLLGVSYYSNPVSYKDRVIFLLEDYFGRDSSSLTPVQQYLKDNVDYVSIDLPASEYYRWFRHLSNERAYDAIMQVHANISREIYDKWGKFTIINPIWGKAYYGSTTTEEMVQLGPNPRAAVRDCTTNYPFSVPSIPAGATHRVTTYQFVSNRGSGYTANIASIIYSLPYRHIPDGRVNINTVHNYNRGTNGCAYNPYGFSCWDPWWVGDYSWSELTQEREIPQWCVQAPVSYIGINSRTYHPYADYIVKIRNYLCSGDKLFVASSGDWTEKKHAGFLRYMLENQRIFTDAVTAGAILYPIKLNRTTNSGYQYVPLIWHEKNPCSGSFSETTHLSEAGLALQKYIRLLTGQKDRYVYERVYAKDACAMQTYGDPSNPISVNKPDPNCVIASYPSKADIKSCRPCTPAELQAGECGEKYQISPDGVFCTVPEGQDPDLYRLNELDYTTATNEMKQLYPLTNPPTEMRCGLCTYNNSVGICTIKNSFTGYVLARHPFSPVYFQPIDMDLMANMYDQNNNRVLCCLVENSFNPISTQSSYISSLLGAGNMTNYYTFLMKKFSLNNPELLIFPHRQGTDLSNVAIGKPEKSQNIYNFVKIDDERDVFCKLGESATINICYDSSRISSSEMAAFDNAIINKLRNDPTVSWAGSAITFRTIPISQVSIPYIGKSPMCSVFITTNRPEHSEAEVEGILEFMDTGRGIIEIIKERSSSIFFLGGIGIIDQALAKQLELSATTSSCLFNNIEFLPSAITINKTDDLIEFSQGSSIPGLSNLNTMSLSNTYHSSAVVGHAVGQNCMNGKLAMGIYRFGRFVAITNDFFMWDNPNLGNTPQMQEVYENMLRYVLRYGR